MHDQPSKSTHTDKWDALLSEYADVFEPPGPPVSRAIDHRIDLVDESAIPSKPRLYRMSKDELAAVKANIDDYL